MTVQHDYAMTLTWSDDTGTDCFSGYSRDHEISGESKRAPVAMSAPEWFRGDRARYNAGELFIAAAASSHMLRFLEIASQVGLVVVRYDDDVVGSAELGSRGDGRIAGITLRPHITVLAGPHATDAEVARMHERAQSMSLVCQSLAISIDVEPGPLTIIDEVVTSAP
jgi:organic hydroperoxide reductase OsmC/OhrA